MSNLVGRSLGVARTVVRIDFLVKECCVLSTVKDSILSEMHRKHPRPGAKAKRVSVISLAY